MAGTSRISRENVTASLSGQRLFPDVSVLLAGILDPGSASNQVLEAAAVGTL